MEATLLEWLAIHGNLCLALRHPQNQGDSRALLVGFVHRLSKLLVERGILTAEEMRAATKLEEDEHGLERVM
jgi:hypothetical protein